MSKLDTKIIEYKSVWEKFVLSQKPKSFLQSWGWGETNKKMGNKIFRLGFYEDDKLVGLCLIIKEVAKRGTYFLIPGGPMIDWQKKRVVNHFIKEIKSLAAKEKVWFIRVRPEIFDSVENRKMFGLLGFIKAPMHLHAENTWILDISGTTESILMGMRKNTRYEVRRSLEANLSFEEVGGLEKGVDELTDLQKETSKRHKFVAFSRKLFMAQLNSFKDVKASAKLYRVKKGYDVLVSAIIIFYGDTAYYHHSASSEKARKLPASYFLQWKVIEEAKKRGCEYYNFWGIAPVGADESHRFHGVTIFKTGFGGERVDWLPAHDLPTSYLYWLTYIFELVRKNMRHL